MATFSQLFLITLLKGAIPLAPLPLTFLSFHLQELYVSGYGFNG